MQLISTGLKHGLNQAVLTSCQPCLTLYDWLYSLLFTLYAIPSMTRLSACHLSAGAVWPTVPDGPAAGPALPGRLGSGGARDRPAHYTSLHPGLCNTYNTIQYKTHRSIQYNTHRSILWSVKYIQCITIQYTQVYAIQICTIHTIQDTGLHAGLYNTIQYNTRHTVTSKQVCLISLCFITMFDVSLMTLFDVSQCADSLFDVSLFDNSLFHGYVWCLDNSLFDVSLFHNYVWCLTVCRLSVCSVPLCTVGDDCRLCENSVWCLPAPIWRPKAKTRNCQGWVLQLRVFAFGRQICVPASVCWPLTLSLSPVYSRWWR